MIINANRTAIKDRADGLRVDLCGGLAGYGLTVSRGWIIRHALHFSTFRVAQDGQRWAHLNLRAFGKGRCFQFRLA